MDHAHGRRRVWPLLLACCLAAGCGAHTALETWREADAGDAGADACDGLELCGNGVDDDCDGRVDWDDPERGEVCATVERCGNLFDDDQDEQVDEGCGDCECTPGTRRWCDDPMYSTVGSQPCEDDGRWGACHEDQLVEACADVDAWYSPSYEQCLIDADECAQDMWDLDGDGDTWESLGYCPDLLCPE